MDRVVVADDHPLFRAAVASAVSHAMPGAQIDECDSLAGARQALASAADLVLLDLKLADCDGFAGLVALRSEFPATPVVVVSASEDVATVRRALAFGASGFIPKSASLTQMVDALVTVLAGDVAAPALPDEATIGELEKRIASLTPSQLRILTGLQRGRLNKQIAFDLGVTEATIKAHLTGVFRKLGVQNRTQAVIAARTLDLDAAA